MLNINIMDGHVLVKLGSLLEGFAAFWTYEGLVSRVGSEMVHHIAFFVKLFTAAVKPAVEH